MLRLSLLLVMSLSAVALAADPASSVTAQSANGSAPQAAEVDNADGSTDDSTSRIYRTVDEQGRPVFTDAPDDRRPSEEVQIREGNTVKMVRPRMAKPAADPVVMTPDYKLAISNPTHEETLNNPEVMRVTITLVPAPAPGHTLRLLDNGEEVAVLIEWPDRGEHRLVAQVIDKAGKVLVESEPVVVYVQRVSLLNKPKK